MKLISCNCCGVVLDQDKIDFPDLYDEDGNIDSVNAFWDGDNYIQTIPCPVCGNAVEKQ